MFYKIHEVINEPRCNICHDNSRRNLSKVSCVLDREEQSRRRDRGIWTRSSSQTETLLVLLRAHSSRYITDSHNACCGICHSIKLLFILFVYKSQALFFASFRVTLREQDKLVYSLCLFWFGLEKLEWENQQQSSNQQSSIQYWCHHL